MVKKNPREIESAAAGVCDSLPEGLEFKRIATRTSIFKIQLREQNLFLFNLLFTIRDRYFPVYKIILSDSI